MDAKRFDNWTKRAAGSSRRRVLTGLAGGFIGGLGLLRGQPGAAQEYDKRGQTCTTNDECNAPCRYCHIDALTRTGRCVYACNQKEQVCDASLSAAGCGAIGGDAYAKGCCVSR
jgi:hypothetical protein